MQREVLKVLRKSVLFEVKKVLCKFDQYGLF